MDLYVRRGLPPPTDPELVDLSAALNHLRGQGAVPDAPERFRNPNSVHMKLANFRARDRPGGGLSHGNQLEADIWERFAADRDLLALEAARIKAGVGKGITIPTNPNNGRAIMALLQPFKPKADITYIRGVAGGMKAVDRNHETLVNAFATWLSDRGLNPGRNLAIDIGLVEPPVIVEAKHVMSWAPAIREAVGQLYEYRYFSIARPEAKLVFLASQRVPDTWIGYLEGDRDIAVAWHEAEGFGLTDRARTAFGLLARPQGVEDHQHDSTDRL